MNEREPASPPADQPQAAEQRLFGLAVPPTVRAAELRAYLGEQGPLPVAPFEDWGPRAR